MTWTDVYVLLPVIVIATAAVVVMLVIAFRRHHDLTVVLSLTGLALSFLTLPLVAPFVPRQVTPLMVFDHYALFYMGLIFATAFAVVWLSHGYLRGRAGLLEEYYLLLLIAVLGAVVLAGSSHFLTFFLGLEILSVALYAMVAYFVTARRALEAGLKYLILSGVATAFLLFGMALVYAELGTMAFARIGVLAGAAPGDSLYLLAGLALILVGVGFKLSAVPFHMWTPDVYQGAPAPVAAFLASVSKAAVFAVLLRYFADIGAYGQTPVLLVLTVLAIASMLVGNLLALLQTSVKRILAYSSIAHVGYTLVALIAGGPLAVEAVSYYLVAYSVTIVGAFGVVAALSPASREGEADTLEDYQGLFWHRPWLAGVFTAMLLSLAGIPLTVGFVGKFYLIAAGVDAALWTLLAALVVGSAIGIYYYLRIVVAMYAAPARDRALLAPIPFSGGSLLALLTVLLVWFGVYPAPLIGWVQRAATGLS